MSKIKNPFYEWGRLRRRKRHKLRISIIQLEQLYEDYKRFSGERRKYQLHFRFLKTSELYGRLSASFVALFTFVGHAIIAKSLWSLVLALVLAVVCAILVQFVERKSDSARTINNPGQVFITYWFASDKHLREVQAEIEHVKPKVDEWRTVYMEQQEQIERDKFAERLQEAKEVQARFEPLLAIIKTEFRSILIRTMSVNLYGLPEDVTLHVTILQFLRTFRNEQLYEIMPDSLDFDLNEETLALLTTYVATLRSFRTAYSELPGVDRNAIPYNDTAEGMAEAVAWQNFLETIHSQFCPE